METVHARVSETHRLKIELSFEFDREVIQKTKKIPGARFYPKDKGGPYWTVPMDLPTSQMLGKLFENNFEPSKELRAWAREQTRHFQKLRTMSTVKEAALTVLPEALPDLAKAVYLGPRAKDWEQDKIDEEFAKLERGGYQAADVRFMAANQHVINANQPGTGKTIETIASVFESETDEGSHLVCCPLTAIEQVWEKDLLAWQPHYVLSCTGHSGQRREILKEALTLYQNSEPFWLIINPQMLQFRSKFKPCSEHKHPKTPTHERRQCPDCEEFKTAPFPELYEIEWDNFIVDEFHKMGLTNPDTATAKGMLQITAARKTATSGTPIGGKAIRVWSILHFLYPHAFASKWTFAEQWLQITQGWGREIGDIREGKEDEFYEMLGAYMVRRTKEECLPWLPPKQYKEIWATMGEAQAKQYEAFARDAEIRIDEEQLSATSILAEYTRLKQFAMAKCDLDSKVVRNSRTQELDNKMIVLPTSDSCKLPYVMEILGELGIEGGDEDTGDEQVIIGSQFSSVVDMVCAYLTEQGIKNVKITGAVPATRRGEIIKEFQSPTGPRVLVMTTTAGGTAITLDRASTCIILDETWNPDDQEQLEDRIHRGSRIHQVMIYYIRTKDTIEEYIADVTSEKTDVNYNILDLRRLGVRATHADRKAKRLRDIEAAV